MGNHANLTESQGIHQPFAWVWANATVRAAEVVVTDDINKIGYQQDTQVVYVLENLTPTWTAIAGATAVSSDFIAEDAVTNALSTALTVGHNSSGSVADGFGTEIEFQAETDTSEDARAGAIGIGWKASAEPDTIPFFALELYGGGANPNRSFVITGTTYAEYAGSMAGRGENVFEFQGRSSDTYYSAGNDSAILGGRDSLIGEYGQASAIIGGQRGELHGANSVILGGDGNVLSSAAYGYYAYGNAIIGGFDNSVGDYTNYNTIVGGANNEVGDNVKKSVVLGGESGLAHFSGQVVTSAGGAAAGDSQGWMAGARLAGETHGDSTWRTLGTNGNSYGVPVRQDSVVAFSAIIAGASSGMAKSFGFKIEGVVENDGGTTSIKGSPTVTTLDDSDDTSFNAQAVADDTNDTLAIQVQDADGAGDVVRWSGLIMAAEVQYA
jgi:hypothetical protein